MEIATPPAFATVEPHSTRRAMTPPSRFGDKAFEWLTFSMALAVVVLVVLIGWQLWLGSSLAIKKFGFHFLTTSTWDPVAEQFGALPFIYGTLVSSLIALLIAVPLSIATAAYLTELAPLWIRQPLVSLIEMLAAIPSVILGLWGIFVMIPWLRDYPFPFLKRLFGWTPFFSGPIYGTSMLAGGIIIAIMILPIITSVSREILRSVPNLQREAAYALGATRWEATRIAVLSYAKKGLFGAVILGLGRALGETMAVTMVIGNTPEIAASLFKPGYTLASVLANEFTEATTDIYLQALFEIGLVLFGTTILANLVAQLLLQTIGSITWGVVVYGLVVLRFKGFSAYAGGLALGLIMVPLIIRTTEEVILLVPNGYREAALALGVSRWKTIVHIVMKTASKGIITGILLALARVGGETAPLLFTAFGNRFWNHNLSEPIAALPLQIFTYAISPYDDWHRQAWAGALVLVTGIFCINVVVRILTRGRTASLV